MTRWQRRMRTVSVFDYLFEKTSFNLKIVKIVKDNDLKSYLIHILDETP